LQNSADFAIELRDDFGWRAGADRECVPACDDVVWIAAVLQGGYSGEQRRQLIAGRGDYLNVADTAAAIADAPTLCQALR
jgi:hypothetical protein